MAKRDPNSLSSIILTLAARTCYIFSSVRIINHFFIIKYKNLLHTERRFFPIVYSQLSRQTICSLLQPEMQKASVPQFCMQSIIIESQSSQSRGASIGNALQSTGFGWPWNLCISSYLQTRNFTSCKDWPVPQYWKYACSEILSCNFVILIQDKPRAT